MTELILGLLDSNAKLITGLIASQTPAVQLILWQRYLQMTQPLHDLLIKLNNLIDPKAAAEDAALSQALAQPPAPAPAPAAAAPAPAAMKPLAPAHF